MEWGIVYVKDGLAVARFVHKSDAEMCLDTFSENFPDVEFKVAKVE